MTGPDHRRLADYVINRRVELEYGSQEELADAAGISVKTVNRLETGAGVASATRGKIERALKWKPGSMRAILSGGEPGVIPAARDPESITDDEVEEALTVMRAGLKRLYPPAEVERRIAQERQEIADARAARARQQRAAG